MSRSAMSFFSLFMRRDMRNRPQILLWLLPFLVFSVWSAPLHLHTPDGREVSLSTFSSAQSSTRLAAFSPGASGAFDATFHVGHTPESQSAGECFLCDWSLGAAAILVVAALSLLQRRAQTLRFFLVLPRCSSVRRSSRSRGPPSLLFESSIAKAAS